MELEGEYPVLADSKVYLTSNGLMGGVVATIRPGGSECLLENGGIRTSTTSAAAGGSGDIMATASAVGMRADSVLVGRLA